MKRIACCLGLVLAMPSMALGLERRDGAYLCTVKFGGGFAYNDAIKRWEGATFPSPGLGAFVLKLSFREATKDGDKYDATITVEEGSSSPPCVSSSGNILINRNAQLNCAVDEVVEYKFNLSNYRFLKIFTKGYLDGFEPTGYTPGLMGGLCIKIQ